MIQQFHGRSICVRLASGIVLRRNRHQLQWRQDLFPTNEIALKWEDETKEANIFGVASGYKPVRRVKGETAILSQEKDDRVDRLNCQFGERTTLLSTCVCELCLRTTYHRTCVGEGKMQQIVNNRHTG